MSIEILKNELKTKNIRNIYLFYGPEEYLKKHYLSSIESLLLDEDITGMNKTVLEDNVEIKNIIDAVETLPMFIQKRLIIVKNSGLFKPKKNDTAVEKQNNKKNEIAEYLQNMPDYSTIIFYESEIDKRIKLVDIIKKNGLLVEFAFQKPAELVKWVIKVCGSFNKEIDYVTSSKLVDYCEQGMTSIMTEINKLVLYAGDMKRIEKSDIEKVCSKSIKSRIFDLTGAISEKNIGKAINVLNDMIILKEPIPKILFMIARHFRQMLEMKLLNEEGVNTSEAASKMGITVYGADKILNQARKFSKEKLIGAIKESLDLDIALKTGTIKDRTAVDVLIYSVIE